jgi:hypothetical protein
MGAVACFATLKATTLSLFHARICAYPIAQSAIGIHKCVGDSLFPFGRAVPRSWFVPARAIPPMHRCELGCHKATKNASGCSRRSHFPNAGEPGRKSQLCRNVRRVFNQTRVRPWMRDFFNLQNIEQDQKIDRKTKISVLPSVTPFSR